MEEEAVAVAEQTQVSTLCLLTLICENQIPLRHVILKFGKCELGKAQQKPMKLTYSIFLEESLQSTWKMYSRFFLKIHFMLNPKVVSI